MRKLLLLTLSFFAMSAVFGQVINTFPFNEDFESQIQGPTGCGPLFTFVGNTWQNGDDAVPASPGHQVDWTVDVGGTGSAGTGPSFDHTLGTAAGKYIYAETSCGGTGFPDIQFHLVSPFMDFTSMTAPQMSFWRHMLGTEGGTLHVDSYTATSGVWTDDIIPVIANANLDQWIEQIVDLTALAGNDSVRIREVSGSGFLSDF
jgi:hypothetical protein